VESLGVGRTSADVRTLGAQRTAASEEFSRVIATRLDEIVRDYTRVGPRQGAARRREGPPRNGGDHAARVNGGRATPAGAGRTGA
jgi:hypothetical protein